MEELVYCRRCKMPVLCLSNTKSLDLLTAFRKSELEAVNFYSSLGGSSTKHTLELVHYPHSKDLITCTGCNSIFHWLEKSCQRCGFDGYELKGTIFAPHLPETDEKVAGLEAVMSTETANPLIRAVRYDKKMIALEGSHRLAAAYRLKLNPRLIELPENHGMDWQGWGDTSKNVLQFVEALISEGYWQVEYKF